MAFQRHFLKKASVKLTPGLSLSATRLASVLSLRFLLLLLLLLLLILRLMLKLHLSCHRLITSRSRTMGLWLMKSSRREKSFCPSLFHYYQKPSWHDLVRNAYHGGSSNTIALTALNTWKYPIPEAGGVCIADEVQTGFGRTGSHYWGFETQGAIPDIVTMAKGIGNGLAVLKVLDKEKRQAHCSDVGSHLLERLRALQQRHEIIGDVRGRGLMVGIELVTDRKEKTPAKAETAVLFEKLRELGILVGKGGLHGNFQSKATNVLYQRRRRFSCGCYGLCYDEVVRITQYCAL
ncbi:hypothetical protein FNV43_RR18474 [Rhamnella rubrinervis]|uniref:alanine--glyoxylate transaminase n=1 Tax=Rhamnella rubrinervis TaxID=2594499 RepID=A0A8K0E560_9ROSA|nr:hypothetical protein FNV43_RR18474 [Rhamnella rubrinervis]